MTIEGDIFDELPAGGKHALYNLVDEAERVYYLYQQSQDELNATHLKNYRMNVDVVKYWGGGTFNDKTLIRYEKI